MAESTLSINYSDLLSDVGLFLGYPSNPEDQSDDQRAELDRYIQSGLRQFYYPPAMEGLEAGYKWSFLAPVAEITTVADQAYNDLPDACGRVLGDFIYAAGTYYPTVPQVSEARMLALRQDTLSGSQPLFCTVRYKTEDRSESESQRLEVDWWPTPTSAYTLTYHYEAYSGKLTEALPYPLGGMKYAELILASCLAVAEHRANDERGTHWDEFQRLLLAGVALDRRGGADTFGFMGGTDMDVGFDSRGIDCIYPNGTVSYEGVDL